MDWEKGERGKRDNLSLTNLSKWGILMGRGSLRGGAREPGAEPEEKRRNFIWSGIEVVITALTRNVNRSYKEI